MPEIQPLISVIVPVFRVSSLIGRCISSIAAQTYKEFELILVDDCGGDDSIDIAIDILQQSTLKDRYKIIRNERNSGVAASRANGMTIADGSYIIHLDSDDYFEPELLTRLYGAIKETGSDMSVCGYITEKGLNKNIDETHLPNGSEDVRLLSTDAERGGYIKEMLANRVPSALWNKLVARELYEVGGISFNADLRDDLSVSPLLVASASKIALIESRLVHYVVYNSSSVSATAAHLRLVATTLSFLESRLPIWIKELCSFELLAYKVRIRRRMLLHRDIDNSQLDDIFKLFPEVNDQIKQRNPERKLHYRILAYASVWGDTKFLRFIRAILRAIVR
jgi:glycosyltransferase involved in cell wall biosynthesis